MEIDKFDCRSFLKILNIDMCSLLPQNNDNKIPFGASLGILASGQVSKEHRHDEFETFFIIKGKGRVECDGESINVNENDVIHFKPFQSHTLFNSGQDDLRFVTMYWRNQEECAAFAANTIQNPSLRSIKKVYVTSTPPTPNGDLHLGHLSGPYLGADVYTRYLKLQGVEAYHISGNDDFQSYVVAKAKQLNLSPEQTADLFGSEIQSTLADINIHLDQYTRPLYSIEYQNDLSAFVHHLWENNILHEVEKAALFDSASGTYLYEVNVKGKCPNCNSLGCGNICEECGHPNECVDMLDPTSNLATLQTKSQSIKRLHFPLYRYEEKIRRHHHHATMGTRLRVLFDQIVSKGLPDVAISHPSNWGVTVPLNDFKDHKIWVWFEMAFGFLFGIREIERRAGCVTENLAIPSHSRVVHFFGYDNAFYHTILFPAIYSAAYPEQPLSIDYAYNEFYLLDGLKFSTSREHAIWGREILKEFSADEVRFYLAYTRPETSRMNFTKNDFIRVYKEELVENWRKWLINVDKRIKEHFSSKVPDAGIWTLEQRHFFRKLQDFIKSMSEAYEIETFSLQKASRLLCELVRETRFFVEGEQHWHKANNCFSEFRTAIALEIAAARLLALLAAPLMPVFSENLWHQLGEKTSIKNTGWPSSVHLAEPGNIINLSDPPIGCNNGSISLPTNILAFCES